MMMMTSDLIHSLHLSFFLQTIPVPVPHLCLSSHSPNITWARMMMSSPLSMSCHPQPPHPTPVLEYHPRPAAQVPGASLASCLHQPCLTWVHQAVWTSTINPSGGGPLSLSCHLGLIRAPLHQAISTVQIHKAPWTEVCYMDTERNPVAQMWTFIYLYLPPCSAIACCSAHQVLDPAIGTTTAVDQLVWKQACHFPQHCPHR